MTKLKAPHHKDNYARLRAKISCWKWSGCVALIIVGCIACGLTYSAERQQELESNSGLLEPANDENTSNVCTAYNKRDGYVQVLLGNVVSSIKSFPHTVIEVSDKSPVLWLTRDDTGRIGVNLDLRDSDNRIIAKMRDNNFVLNPNKILSRSRADFSTIGVQNEYGEDALKIRYMNPSTIAITGKLARPGNSALIIPQAAPNGICMSDNGVDITL